VQSSDDDSAERWNRLIPFLAGAGFFALMAALYLGGVRQLYHGIIVGMGVEAFPAPFLDTDTVLSAVRCVRKGVDVFVANPCDPLQRVFDYSPLWLLLAKLPPALTGLNPLGLLTDIAFLGVLLLLPGGRTRGDAWTIAAGVISSAVVFAVERGNNDLVLFALVAGAAALAMRSAGFRFVGYGLALLAGLLKYYPMMVLAIAVREAPKRFLLAVALALAGVALFLLFMGHDLSRALKLVPTGDWMGGMFGSSTFGGGVREWFDLPGWTAPAIRIGLSALALGLGAFLAGPRWIGGDLASLSERERCFLFAGSLLLLGCFFTAQNIGYRVTHVLLVLPALIALRRVGRHRRLYTTGLVCALGVLWADGWWHWIDQVKHVTDPDNIDALAWAIREGMWWTLVTLLIGSVLALALQSTMGRLVLGRRIGVPPL
jgi:hypothetical protein